MEIQTVPNFLVITYKNGMIKVLGVSRVPADIQTGVVDCKKHMIFVDM